MTTGGSSPGTRRCVFDVDGDRAAVPTSDRPREPDAGEDRYRSRTAEMTRNVHRIEPASRRRGGVLQRGEGPRGPIQCGDGSEQSRSLRCCRLPRQDGEDGSVTGWVLHVDMDQFLAAVEVLRCPELAGRPVIVGGRGDPAERAVVSTASYEARQFGIRSGMPLKTAARRCPEAVFLPVDFPVYEAASALRAFPALSLSCWVWDDAFVGAQGDAPEVTVQGPVVRDGYSDSARGG